MSASDPKIVPLRPRGAHAPEAPNGAFMLDDALARHLDSLFATARLLTGENAAAEDLVQETALAAFRFWGDLREPGAVKGWLLRILHNTFVSSHRHRGRRPPFVDLDIDEILSHPLLRTEPPVAGGPLSDDVAAALEALPVEFREAVWLIDVEELTVAEAARVLDIPVGTAASRVHRARRQLRERLSATHGRRE